MGVRNWAWEINGALGRILTSAIGGLEYWNVSDNYRDTDYPREKEAALVARVISVPTLSSGIEQYRFSLRLLVADPEKDQEQQLRYVSMIREVLRQNEAFGNLWHGLQMGPWSATVDDADDDRRRAHMILNVNRIPDSPILVDGTEIEQFMYVDSVDDAALSLANGGSSVVDNLKDRSTATLGIDHTTDSTITLEIDFGAARAVDYFLLYGLSTGGNTEVIFYAWTGAVWEQVKTATAATYSGGKLYFRLTERRKAAKYKFELNPQGNYLVQLATLFMGEEYRFPRPYEFTDRFEIEGTERDEKVKGWEFYKNVSNTLKLQWRIVFMMTQAEFEAFEDEMVPITVDQKNFVFRDTFRRGGDFFLVRNQIGAVQGNRVSFNILRVKLEFGEV